ncbi:MAG TPA: (2Fe-2S) ferredoxin domain-containing protein [Bacillota bacterium]|nr:(2Fe-2S) ferredoxin domain-containing protein [Bacillota bacterium]
MKITVCVGSSCHFNGSRQFVDKLKLLLDEHNLRDKVQLSGEYCMDDPGNGISVRVNNENISVRHEQTEEFFNEYVMSKLIA